MRTHNPVWVLWCCSNCSLTPPLQPTPSNIWRGRLVGLRSQNCLRPIRHSKQTDQKTRTMIVGHSCFCILGPHRTFQSGFPWVFNIGGKKNAYKKRSIPSSNNMRESLIKNGQDPGNILCWVLVHDDALPPISARGKHLSGQQESSNRLSQL
jgi:hypothetical protein